MHEEKEREVSSGACMGKFIKACVRVRGRRPRCSCAFPPLLLHTHNCSCCVLSQTHRCLEASPAQIHVPPSAASHTDTQPQAHGLPLFR